MEVFRNSFVTQHKPERYIKIIKLFNQISKYIGYNMSATFITFPRVGSVRIYANTCLYCNISSEWMQGPYSTKLLRHPDLRLENPGKNN